MTLWRAAAAALVAALLSGCANLSSPAKPPDAAASAPPAHAEYRLEVQAPDELRKLLANYLDLARFQSAPATEGINSAELDRLMRAAPAQARELLETEGYFNATVTVSPPSSDTGLPLVRVIVEPGPRATVGSVTLEAVGDLQKADAAHELELLRSRWLLPVRQATWTDAKNLTLARLRADGYAAAGWQSTHARVDAAANRVDLTLLFDSGPLFHVGALHIEGLQRYDEDSVRKLANFGPGEPYSEKLLLDFQERIQKLGLFEGASVEIDPDPAHASAAAVLVRVKEQPLHQATIGIGYSANTGPRVSLEHTDRRVFGSHWVAHNKFAVGPEQQSWEGELTSHPLDNLYRNLVSGSATRLLSDDQVQLSWNARLGRTQDTPRIERLYFGELAHARVDSATLTSQADAASVNYHWVYRDIDNVLLPTRGLTTTLQAGVGHAHGSRAALDEPFESASGPFARLYARLTWYQPFGDAWYGTARVEGGQVLTRNVVGIPDTLLFRAGGDDSVRGYGYRTLAPSIDGVAVGGRSLFTSSLEVARPISPRYPAYWWAVFVDAGNAADKPSELKPAVGYGVGLRWRSPVGPLRVDLAYGEQTKQVRMHLSVGIAF
jgi:translocation and assembly module TamA